MDISTLKSRPLNLLEDSSVVRTRLRDASTVQVFEIRRQGNGAISLRWKENYMRARWGGVVSQDAVEVRFKLRENLHVESGGEFGGKKARTLISRTTH